MKRRRPTVRRRPGSKRRGAAAEPRTPRPSWTGTISFSLVEIPVVLVPAEESREEIKFAFLDRRDFSPVGYERVSKKSGKVVPWEDVVRGYEYDDDEYVVLSDKEIEHANRGTSRTIEIVDFVDGKEIEPVYFDRPYYVKPVKKDSKGYVLLRETLRRTGKVGIAKVVLRTRQHLAALLVRGPVLVLELLRYAHEVRETSVIGAPGDTAKKGGVSAKEIDMAERIVEGMSARWDPKKYRDEYHDDILALVRKKIRAGQAKVIEEPEEERVKMAEVVDLMPLLKKSIETARSAKRAKKTGARRSRSA